MEDILTNLPAWVSLLPSIFLGLVLIATVVVRLTPSTKDDLIVGKGRNLIMKVLQMFPTLGKNPLTKQLEDAVESLNKEKQAETSSSDT